MTYKHPNVICHTDTHPHRSHHPLRTDSYALTYFCVYQLVYTVLTIAPTLLYLRYCWLHSLLLVGVFGVCVWNGGSFYIEVFSRRYVAELEKAAAALNIGSVPASPPPSASSSSSSSGSDSSPARPSPSLVRRSIKTANPGDS